MRLCAKYRQSPKSPEDGGGFDNDAVSLNKPGQQELLEQQIDDIEVLLITWFLCIYMQITFISQTQARIFIHVCITRG